MKRIYCLLYILILSMLSATSYYVNDNEYGFVTSNCYSKDTPSLESSDLYYLDLGDVFITKSFTNGFYELYNSRFQRSEGFIPESEFCLISSTINETGRAKLPSGTMNIRKSPDITSSKVTSVKNGAQLFVVESLGNWCKVEVNGKVGFAMLQYIVLPNPLPTITLPVTSFPAGGTLALNPVVSPTNLTVNWSIESSTAANAKVIGNVLSASGEGTINLLATVPNGKGSGRDFTKDFVITVTAAAKVPSLVPAAQSDNYQSSVMFNLSDMRIVQNGAGHVAKEIRKLNPKLKKSALYTSGNVLVIDLSGLDEPLNIKDIHWEWLVNGGIEVVRLIKDIVAKEFTISEMMNNPPNELWVE